jgi:cardiolipin synthase
MFESIYANAFAIALLVAYVLAVISAARAILHTRTAQGSMAWVLALLLMPLLTVPLYWVFGRTKFFGYVHRRQQITDRARKQLSAIKDLDGFLEEPPGELRGLHALAGRLGAGGFVNGNSLQLLIDGEATYEAILDRIASAERFVLIQFYIFRDDAIGQRFQRALIERARAGVTVCFLFDEVGSSLSSAFLADLAGAGVKSHQFNPGRKGSRFQINFRNHRKIVVVDGSTAFIGGLNVGDDYLGKYPKIGRWRDTHLRIDGPGAAQAQIAFFKDWFWATDELPKADFKIAACDQGESRVLVWHTGPADLQPECLMYWLELINRAKRRLWIANPYFVPPEAIAQALRLAVLRGVEVRLLVPGSNDSVMVAWASCVHLSEMAECGASVYRWTEGFMHQKVCLADDDLAMIGTANLDNRSIFINFEVSALSDDPALIKDLAAMLERDFNASRKVAAKDFREAGYWTRLACRSANLFAPML